MADLDGINAGVAALGEEGVTTLEQAVSKIDGDLAAVIAKEQEGEEIGDDLVALKERTAALANIVSQESSAAE